MHVSVQAVMYKFGFSDVRRKAGQECNFRITAIASIAHAHLHSPLIVLKGCHVNLKGTIFLVACSRLYNPLCCSVGRSVALTVALSFFYRFCIFGRRLHYCSCPNAWFSLFPHCPCPPARDFGALLYGNVKDIPHARPFPSFFSGNVTSADVVFFSILFFFLFTTR